MKKTAVSKQISVIIPDKIREKFERYQFGEIAEGFRKILRAEEAVVVSLDENRDYVAVTVRFELKKTFVSKKILDSLSRVSEAFDVEYWIDKMIPSGKTCSLYLTILRRVEK